eukprot:g699.t1
MSSRVIPADNAGRDQSSRKSRRSLPQLPVRSQSTVNETILQIGLSLRQLSETTKVFQGELEGFLEKCKGISFTTLESLFETDFHVNDLWEKVFRTKWRPTRQNKRVLCENILQNCMIYIRSERIGKVDGKNVLKTFGSLVVLDLFEFAAVANIIIFFYMGEVMAGWILLVCLIVERVFQVIGSMATESFSLSSALASLLGVKKFLTSYHIACFGFHGNIEGMKMNLIAARMFQKGVNLIFATTPQAILNAYMVFSKLKTGKPITTMMRIQIFVILTLCFVAGMNLTNLNHESDQFQSLKGYYKSMTQILSKDDDQFVAALLKGGWNICHNMLVSCALGALFAKASPLVWVSIMITYFVLLNILRYAVNKGELRVFIRMDSSWTASLGSMLIPAVLYTFGVGLMPVSILRWHCILGPAVYGFGWMSSFLVSSITLLYLSSDIFLRIFFAILVIIYIALVFAYFSYLKPEARETFYWSEQNWKDILRTEWWENPHYESDGWKDIHLIGDKGANYARMV